MTPDDADACLRCARDLRSAGITDDSAFRRWSRTAHPDRGGDTEAYQRMSQCRTMVLMEGCEARAREQQRRRARWGDPRGGTAGNGFANGRGGPYAGAGADPRRLAEVTVAVLQAMKARGVALDVHMPVEPRLRRDQRAGGAGRGRRRLPGAIGVRILHHRPLGIPLPFKLWHEAEVVVGTSARSDAGRGGLEDLGVRLEAVGVAWRLGERLSAHASAVPAVNGVRTRFGRMGGMSVGSRVTVRRTLGMGLRLEVGVSDAGGALQPVVGLVGHGALSYKHDANDGSSHTVSGLGCSYTWTPSGDDVQGGAPSPPGNSSGGGGGELRKRNEQDARRPVDAAGAAVSAFTPLATDESATRPPTKSPDADHSAAAA